MRQTIRGKLYDSDTAKEVAKAQTGSAEDPSCFTERLLRKKTGEFFLHGSGGPSSKYAVPFQGGTWQSGERLTPLTYAQADRWARENLTHPAYLAAFGPPKNDEHPDKRINVTLRLSKRVVDRTRRLAAQQDKTLSLYVEEKLSEEKKEVSS